ncbi:hypothetical protein KJ885_05660, partial [Patescibacteria group bacterium]|nr:hypothetical protein [Patescibacteria group bacterium]
APKVKDEHSKEGKKGKKQKGLCYEDWEHLQNWNFPDNSTEDEIRYFIPKLIPDSTSQTLTGQQVLIDQIAKKLKEQCKECKNIDISMGQANQIANQILAYYNKTKKRIPEKELWVRTLTLHIDGRRLPLGGFDAVGLRCGSWLWGGDSYPHLGSFLSGVEKLGNKKTRKQELTNPQS